MRKRLSQLACVYLAIWLLVSLAALGGMYKLWWGRERIDYLGQPVSTQRQIVWDRAGLPGSILTSIERIESSWPESISYQAQGDHNRLSYAKYLLIPRIPSGSETYILKDDGSFAPEVVNESATPRHPDREGNPSGLILSISVLAGLGLAIRRLTGTGGISFPEAFGCALLLAMTDAVVSRALFQDAVPGFIFLTVLGILAWMYLFSRGFSLGRLWSQMLRFLPRKTGIDRSHLSKGIFLAIITLSIIWSLLMSVVVVPDDWDAWAIWGPKAKVLALGVGPLSDVTFFGHPDYPLLWPSIWAYSAWLSGGWEEMWSKGLGAVFLLLCIWEIVVIVKRSTDNTVLGLLGGAIFASIPMVALVSSWGYAEAPFWLLSTACAGCLLLFSQRDGTATRVICIAALLAVGAAYTKNEGVLFAVLASLWILLLPGNKRVAGFLLFSSIFACLYAPWFYWTKLVLGLGSHAISGLHFDVDNVLRVMDRIGPAVRKIGQIWVDIRQWNVVLAGVVLAGLFCMPSADFRKKIALPLMVLSGYFVITIFHDAEIYWQVGTSWNRLTLHAMPLLTVFCVHYVSALITNNKA